MGIPSLVADGKLYLVGGNAIGDREGVTTTNLDIYDPMADSWKAAAPIPIGNPEGDPNYVGQYAIHPLEKGFFSTITASIPPAPTRLPPPSTIPTATHGRRWTPPCRIPRAPINRTDF
jgi:hypothetical protein